MAGPTPAQIEYQLQHIQDDRSDEIIAAFGVCLGIATITVLLRFVTRHLTRAPLKGDDWAVVFGLVRESCTYLSRSLRYLPGYWLNVGL